MGFQPAQFMESNFEISVFEKKIQIHTWRFCFSF